MTKTIEDYRHDIQLLKHKLNKLQEVNKSLHSRLSLDEGFSSLYSIPVSSSLKTRSTREHFMELLRVCRYRGLTLEAIFRALDVNCSREVELETFRGFLAVFLGNEGDRLITHVISALDMDYSGRINRDQYHMLLQSLEVESEEYTFTIKRISLDGMCETTYANVHELAWAEVGTLTTSSFIGMNLEEFSNATNLPPTLSKALLNCMDRYWEGRIMQSSQIICKSLNLNIDQLSLFRQLRDSLGQSTSPLGVFGGKGKLQIGVLLRLLDQQMKGFDSRLALRLLDYHNTGFVDSFQFVYALMNERDLGMLCADNKLRSLIVSHSTHDLEVLSLLALRMNSLGMKPSYWFKMMTKGQAQESVQVHVVRDSILKLGIGMCQAVEIVRLLDSNFNFFIENTEIANIFGSHISMSTYYIGYIQTTKKRKKKITRSA